MGEALVLRGTISTYPITLHLQSAGATYRGNYFYDRVGIPLSLTGERKQGVITLECYNEAGTEIFRLLEDGSGGFRGTWDPGNGKSPLKVVVTRSPGTGTFNVAALKDSARPVTGHPEILVDYGGETIWPIGDSPQDRFMKSRLRALLGGNPAGTAEPLAVMRSNRNSFFAKHLEAVRNTKPADLADMGTSLSWGTMQVIQAEYRNQFMMTVGYMEWEFTGGAHGNGGTKYEVWDLVRNRVLSLKDVLTPAGIRALPALQEKYFRRNKKVPAGEPLKEHGLFEDHIKEVSENFFMTSSMLILSYVPYEIGPYMMGQIEIQIPFSELKTFLQPLIGGYLRLPVP